MRSIGQFWDGMSDRLVIMSVLEVWLNLICMALDSSESSCTQISSFDLHALDHRSSSSYVLGSGLGTMDAMVNRTTRELELPWISRARPLPA